MGDFVGHMIPSSVYLLLAVWWSFVISVKFARWQIKQKPYKGSMTQPFFFLASTHLRTFPLESLLKLVALLALTINNLVAGIYYLGHGKFYMEMLNAHHCMMFAGFMLAAIVEILVHYRAHIPPKSEYVFNGLGFMIQFLIMADHKSPELQWKLHQSWLLLIGLTLVAFVCECFQPDQIWLTYLRVGFFLTQGTWIAEIAFVLWPPWNGQVTEWDASQNSFDWLNIHLMLHILLCFSFILALYWFVQRNIDHWDRLFTKYEADMNRMWESGSEMKHFALVEDDNEEMHLI